MVWSVAEAIDNHFTAFKANDRATCKESIPNVWAGISYNSVSLMTATIFL